MDKLTVLDDVVLHVLIALGKACGGCKFDSESSLNCHPLLSKYANGIARWSINLQYQNYGYRGYCFYRLQTGLCQPLNSPALLLVYVPSGTLSVNLRIIIKLSVVLTNYCQCAVLSLQLLKYIIRSNPTVVLEQF